MLSTSARCVEETTPQHVYNIVLCANDFRRADKCWGRPSLVESRERQTAVSGDTSVHVGRHLFDIERKSMTSAVVGFKVEIDHGRRSKVARVRRV